MVEARQPLNATATGQLHAESGTVAGMVLCAGADAATATLRTGGAGGKIIAKLGAGAGLSASWTPSFVVPFTDLHLTVTGTTPQVTVHV